MVGAHRIKILEESGGSLSFRYPANFLPELHGWRFLEIGCILPQSDILGFQISIALPHGVTKNEEGWIISSRMELLHLGYVDCQQEAKLKVLATLRRFHNAGQLPFHTKEFWENKKKWQKV